MDPRSICVLDPGSRSSFRIWILDPDTSKISLERQHLGAAVAHTGAAVAHWEQRWLIGSDTRL